MEYAGDNTGSSSNNFLINDLDDGQSVPSASL